MRYLSVCSGIEAATVAAHPLGWEPVAFAEIEPFPSAVLAHHYPTVPNLGDFTAIEAHHVGTVDLLVGGTPCQAFSVAGKRAGLDDPRGNLTLEFLALAGRLRPRWVVWENVPGVLSLDGGRTFGAILGALGQLGYGFAYRVLDAQHFGVPQRRRRVFVVGCAGGDWQRAAAVLFERAGLCGDSPASGEAGEDVAAFACRGVGDYAPGKGSLRASGADCGGGSEVLVAGTLGASSGGADDNDAADGRLVVGTLGHNGRAAGSATQQDAHAGMLIPIDLRQASRGEKITNNRSHGSGGAPGHGVGNAGDNAFTVSERGQAVAFGWQNSAQQGDSCGNVSPSLDKSKTPAVLASGVRRLMPVETERLQGFPDHYTATPYRGKPAADGPRYKAIGNSMAVPVMRWIFNRIAMVDAG